MSAQDPVVRARLVRWQDSLARIHDTALLEAQEQVLLRAVQQDPADPMHHLRLGWLGLRRGALGENRHFDNAAAEFQYVVDLVPEWPLAWLGLGVAELYVAETEAERAGSDRRRLGGDARSRAAAALTRALHDEPTLLPDVLALVRDWRGTGVTARAVVLREVARSVADQPIGRDHDLLLIRAATERALGTPDSAARALELLIESGDTTSSLLLRLAVARFEGGRYDGLRPWYAGLIRADGTTLARYRAQLAPLLTSRDLIRFDRFTASERRTWVDSLIRRREGLGLLGDGQRLLVHYQRLRDVQAALTSSDSLIPFLLRDTIAVLDDPRAQLYLRQGAPTVLVDLPIPGLPASASWRYGDAATGWIFHFVAPDSLARWQHSGSLRELLGTTQGRGMGEDTVVLRASRLRLGGRFAATSSATLSWERLVDLDRRDVARAHRWNADGDRVSPGFTERLAGDLTLIGLGGDAAATAEVQLLYAVPVAALRRVQVGVRPGVDIRMRATLFAADSTVLAALDTVTFVTPTSPPTSGDILYGRIALPATAAAMLGRALLYSGPAGLEMPVGVALHPGGGAGGVGVADLAFGWEGGHLSWVLPTGDTTWLAPTFTLPTGKALMMTTQLFGQPIGATVQVETTVRQPRGGFVLVRAVRRLLGQSERILRREVVAVPIRTPASWLVRPLDTATLPAGQYTVRVRMTTPTGRSFTRDRVLLLED